jgi:DNA-binding transcriptional regulator YiaG
VKGIELKRKREDLGLSQAELAEILAVKSNTVSRWEREVLVVPKTVELAIEALERRFENKECKK